MEVDAREGQDRRSRKPGKSGIRTEGGCVTGDSGGRGTFLDGCLKARGDNSEANVGSAYDDRPRRQVDPKATETRQGVSVMIME